MFFPCVLQPRNKEAIKLILQKQKVYGRKNQKRTNPDKRCTLSRDTAALRSDRRAKYDRTDDVFYDEHPEGFRRGLDRGEGQIM